MPDFDLKDHTIIITGANAGIGKAAALELAGRGATVVMACRSAERGKTARDEIVARTGNDRVDLMLVDMASQDSVRQFAAGFLSKYSRLHGLINNAANFDISVKQPVIRDGIEEIFATNHLGPVLLTLSLLDALRAGAPARILDVSSKGLVTMPLIAIQFDDLTTSRARKYNPAYAYYHSKLAQVMFTYALARRLEGTGVTANAVRVPNVRVDASRYPNLHPLLLKLYDIKQRAAITPEQMAAAYARLIAAPDFAAANGQYFDEHCRTVSSPRSSYDRAAQERLWEISLSLTGLAQP